jgi:hypothetical protein
MRRNMKEGEEKERVNKEGEETRKKTDEKKMYCKGKNESGRI